MMQQQPHPFFMLRRSTLRATAKPNINSYPQNRMMMSSPPVVKTASPFSNLVAHANREFKKDLPIGKMEWGKHVWNMIHSLTVLVKEEEFPRIRTELLNLLFLICSNLPCPICSDHAKEYLKGINFNAIQTKEQFKNLFHQFHNFVSSKKQLPIFPRELLEETYQTAILPNILTNFLIAFRDKTYNPRHISDQHIRTRVVRMFTEWIQKNIHCF